jgi:hypothetical protein
MTVHRRLSERASRLWGRLRRCSDVGSVTIGVVTWVLPVTVIMILVAMFCFRVAVARMQLASAAAAAARAASLARAPAAAQDAADQAAAADLAGHNRTCNPMTVSVDTSDFRPGGRVRVTVRCTVSTAGLTGLNLRGSLSGAETATAVIDTFRQLNTS